tara:strand:+ start:1793 stop:1972 length:180 start_codon:yes stop_codon:yes gene_type:complete
MRRYTEWLKEKLMCDICKREISRGHIANHIKSKIHIKNSDALVEKENKKLSQSVIIHWD